MARHPRVGCSLPIAAGDYVLTEFPDDGTLEREARARQLLAYCPERTFSFCLKNGVNVDGKLMFRKVTFKHCYECIHADEIEGTVS